MKTRQMNHCFTLIELLVVIVIIMILSSILFPALSSIQERGKITETQTLVTGVKTAIDTFRTDNGYLPYFNNSSQDQGIDSWSGNNDLNQMEASADYIKFFDILTYLNCEGSSGSQGQPSETAKNYNPKAQRYLSAPKKYFAEKKEYKNSVRDSWNRPLYIMLDLDGDDSIEVAEKYTVTSNKETYFTSAYVVSLGSQSVSKYDEIGKPQRQNFILSNK